MADLEYALLVDRFEASIPAVPGKDDKCNTCECRYQPLSEFSLGLRQAPWAASLGAVVPDKPSVHELFDVFASQKTTETIAKSYCSP